MIGEVNEAIRDKLSARKPNEFFYNDTAYDNFNDPSYGHDGLIALACHIFESFPTLGRIVSDLTFVSRKIDQCSLYQLPATSF